MIFVLESISKKFQERKQQFEIGIMTTFHIIFYCRHCAELFKMFFSKMKVNES